MRPAPERIPAAEHAYKAIRDRIVSGRLVEGERLTEQRLSDDLCISRTPVRAAISRLILEGFLERQSGYTTRVAHFPKDEVAQIFEIRRLLETYSARRAALYATPEEVDGLRATVAEMRANTPPALDAHYTALTEANEQFHRKIVTAARSPRLTALMMNAIDVGMVVRTYRIYSDRDLARSLNHHEELIEAIAARAPDWAEAVMSAHLLAGVERVLDALAEGAEAAE